MLTWDSVSKRLAEHLRDRPDDLRAPNVWLAKRVGVSKQAVSNWVDRRAVPADKWIAVAKALECGLDELLGIPSARAWPFETVPQDQWAALSERQKGMVELAVLESLRHVQAMSGKQDSQAA